MRGVGKKSFLSIEGGAQPFDQAIHALDNRRDFGRNCR